MCEYYIAHVGINCENEEEALKGAKMFEALFGLTVKNGNSSVFAGTAVELNKKYNLLIHLGLTSVKFEATVSNWDLDSTPAGGTGTEDSDGDGIPDATDHDYDVHVPINVK